MAKSNKKKNFLNGEKFKAVSNSSFRGLGVDSKFKEKVNTLEDLQKNPPYIVVGKALRSIKYFQNKFPQYLTKGKSYVMGLGVYMQLSYDKQTKVKILKPGDVKFKNLYKKYNGQDLNNKTILFMRTGGIGDLLFIKPNIDYLKQKYPTCKVIFACGTQYHGMVRNWKCIDKLIELPFELEFLREADYHGIFEGVIERCLLAEKENCYRLFTKWLGLNLPDEYLVPKQTPEADKVEEVRNILQKENFDKFLTLQVRASSPIRTPSPSFWSRIVNQLVKNGVKLVILDSPHMSEQIDKLKKYFFNDSENILNFTKYSKDLSYAIAAVSLSRGSITTDSSIAHITESLNKPIFSIYGPFPGKIRLATYKNAYWVDAEKECCPCFIHSQQPCPHSDQNGYPLCFNNIDTDDFSKKVLEYWRSDV